MQIEPGASSVVVSMHVRIGHTKDVTATFQYGEEEGVALTESTGLAIAQCLRAVGVDWKCMLDAVLALDDFGAIPDDEPNSPLENFMVAAHEAYDDYQAKEEELRNLIAQLNTRFGAKEQADENV